MSHSFLRHFDPNDTIQFMLIRSNSNSFIQLEQLRNPISLANQYPFVLADVDNAMG